MSSAIILGALIATIAGFSMGTAAWPIKVLKKFQFEHWLFISAFVGPILLPWIITLSFCPHAITAIRSIDTAIIIKCNLFSIAWGIANVLVSFCLTRIGVSLATALVTGLGGVVGALTPMIIKGSGKFSQASGLGSPAGRTVLLGILVMLMGVALVSLAGFGRERTLKSHQQRSGGFLQGLMLCVLAGILSSGTGLAFIYCQKPIVDAMKLQGVSETASGFAIWAVGLFTGALINLGCAAYLMTRNKSWSVLLSSGKELLLATVIGIQFCSAMALMGQGMLVLGALGGSVGWGIYQSIQMMGSQGLGFVSGEWNGVHGRPRTQMYVAIAVLILASVIMAYGSSLAKH